jgi:hypothetical protein
MSEHLHETTINYIQTLLEQVKTLQRENKKMHKKLNKKWSDEELFALFDVHQRYEGEWSEEVEGELDQLFNGKFRMKSMWKKWQKVQLY